MKCRAAVKLMLENAVLPQQVSHDERRIVHVAVTNPQSVVRLTEKPVELASREIL